MQDKSKIFNKALNLQTKGKFKEAIKLYSKLLKEDVNKDKLLFLTGTSYLQSEQYSRAIEFLDKSIKINPNLQNAYNNKGIALTKLNQFSESILEYNKAINLNNNFFDAYLNKGFSLRKLKNYKEAIECFKFCKKLDPKQAKIYNNLGDVYSELKEYNESIQNYNKAIFLNEDYAGAYYNRGRLLSSLGNYRSAINDLKEAIKQGIKLNQHFHYILGDLFFAKMNLSEWDEFFELKKEIEEGIKNRTKVIRPFQLLSLNDDQKKHKIAAEIYAKEYSLDNFKKVRNPEYKNKKLKIGYFSPDFRKHPVGQSIIDVFRNHDKSKFEIYGFYHGPRKDEITKEIKKNFNEFFDIYNKSEEEILNLCYNNQIDIAVDLCGYTNYSITEIFSKRVAPIQINFFGYSGTTGGNFHDYIIADKHIIPPDEFKNFSENVIYLPNCFLPSQSNVEISKKEILKKDLNLPDEKFIFGCLNSITKINPIIFNSWMKILNKCEKSILWLLRENKESCENLINEAKKRGIDKERIIFAEKMKTNEHLKRMKYIDLFLDTHPYGAHVTTSEALRMGVPVLTMMGNSFASRVAGSMLECVGLKQLITNNLEEYTKSAIELQQDHHKLQNIKNHLLIKQNTDKLFNSKKYTQDLEKIFLDLTKN